MVAQVVGEDLVVRTDDGKTLGPLRVADGVAVDADCYGTAGGEDIFDGVEDGFVVGVDVEGDA